MLFSTREEKMDKPWKITESFNPHHHRHSNIQWLGDGSRWSGVVQEEEKHNSTWGHPGFKDPQAGVSRWPKLGLGQRQPGCLSPSAKTAPTYPQHAGACPARVHTQTHQHPFLHIGVTLQKQGWIAASAVAACFVGLHRVRSVYMVREYI